MEKVLRYIYLGLQRIGKLTPKKVNRDTTILSRYNKVDSHRGRKDNDVVLGSKPVLKGIGKWTVTCKLNKRVFKIHDFPQRPL